MNELILKKLDIITSKLTRLERLADRVPISEGVMLVVLKNGVRMAVDTGSIDVGQWLIREGEWEPSYSTHFLSLLRPNECVYDIGANIGWYSMLAANHVRNSGGKVVALEPNPNLSKLIELSKFANGFQSILSVFNLAITDKEEILNLAVLKNMPGSSTTRRHEGALGSQGETTEYKVQGMPLSKIVDLAGGGAPTFIKMDTEGWEGVILSGAEHILSSVHNLRIMMEWSTQMDGTPVNRTQAAEILIRNGFVPYLIDANMKLTIADWEMLKNSELLLNLYLAKSSDPLI